MPTADALGRAIPNTSESPNVPAAFAAYSLSSPPGPFTVGSRAAANSVLSAIGNPVGLHVWRSDIDQEERWNGTGWEYVAGRQHGATVTFTGSVTEGGTPNGLSAASFVRASAGWTADGSGYIVIPQTGMYLMYGSANLSGVASTIGRTFIQFATSTGAFGSRFPATNEDNYAGMAMWPFTKGDRVRVLGFHTGGGTRTYTVTTQIAMLNSPNW